MPIDLNDYRVHEMFIKYKISSFPAVFRAKTNWENRKMCIKTIKAIVFTMSHIRVLKTVREPTDEVAMRRKQMRYKYVRASCLREPARNKMCAIQLMCIE